MENGEGVLIRKEFVRMGLADLVPYDNNPRKNDNAVPDVAESIRQCGDLDPIEVDENNVILSGHTRLMALEKQGYAETDVIRYTGLTEEQKTKYRLLANKTGEKALWDFDMLADELDGLDFDGFDFGFDVDEGIGLSVKDDIGSRLADRFIVPPFSVLDARQGAWQERKRVWKDAIGDAGQARDVHAINPAFAEWGSDITEASVLDPVLSEIIIKWFCPDGGKVFDNFAGDTVFGYVSSYLGMQFTGIELRQEQVDFNNERVHGLDATYICDDGRNVLSHIEPESQDLYFSCPPYYDLEVYSDDERDVSNQSTYGEFYSMLETAFIAGIKCLKENRFAVIVCGDVRDKRNGHYYCFPDDIKRTFTSNGMALYNEMVLLDPIGTAMIRANKSMRSRKVVKVHQNVLVFYKGDTRRIKSNYPAIEVDYDSADME